MNESKLLQYLQSVLKERNKTIIEQNKDITNLNLENISYRNMIEILTLLLILSAIGNVFMIFLLTH